MELGPKHRLRMNQQKMKVYCRSAAKTKLRQRESNLGTQQVFDLWIKIIVLT